MIEKWKLIKEERAHKKEVKEYEMQYGEGSWKTKGLADDVIERLRREEKQVYLSSNFIDESQITGYRRWEWMIRENIELENIPVENVFHSFKSCYKALEEPYPLIRKYKWLSDAWFHPENLEEMIQFHIYLNLLREQTIQYESIKKEAKNQGIQSREIESLKNEIKSLRSKTFQEMEQILNPVTQTFNDDTSKEDAFLLKVQEQVKRLTQLSNKPKTPQAKMEHQIESLHQLQSVLEDDWVSPETKKEVEETMSKIEEQLLVEKERENMYQAELNARAIIQASLIVHQITPNDTMSS